MFSICLVVSEGGAIRVVADCLIFILSICALFLHNLCSVVYCEFVYCELALFDCQSDRVNRVNEVVWFTQNLTSCITDMKPVFVTGGI